MPARRQGVPIVGPGKTPIQLLINGKHYTATVEPCVTLLDAMRELWDLTGAKRVCDRATCGACTVLVDGRRAYACALLAIDVQDSQITTIESLGSNGSLDPVQRAFIANDAMQFGFCTPGFVMSCKGFLLENPHPTADEILKGMSGNLCRCGTYAGIQKAVAAVAAEAQARRRGGTRRPRRGK